MEKSFVENGFIINLSNSKNTNQLVYELSNIMEHPDVKGKRVCLKLGSIDLKQSQLLSIKALIESMDATIAYVDTTSEQTKVSAESVNIDLAPSAETSIEIQEENLKEELVTEVIPQDEKEDEVGKVVEVSSEMDSAEELDESPINTIEGIEDTFTESSEQQLSEIIPSENYETKFELLAEKEGLLNKEDSKYILLETGEVLPEGAEDHNADTKTLPTLYLSQTLRSGQTVSYKGNILIVGDAHPGSEIIADGDITVWGILGGIAHAGSKGNASARVRALKLNAIQLRIAGLYARRNDSLNVPYVQKSNEFTPEEALIENGKIVIYKKLRRD